MKLSDKSPVPSIAPPELRYDLYALKHNRNLILKAHKYNNIKMNITIVIALVSVVLHGVL